MGAGRPLGAQAGQESVPGSIPGVKRVASAQRLEVGVGNGGSAAFSSRGAFILLEGLDRSGKTSQCERLLAFLTDRQIPAEIWRYPDRRTTVGKMISSYLSKKSELDDATIHLLFAANRWEKREEMEARLRSGCTLIVDRYSFSGIAFSAAKGLDLDWCKAPEVGLIAPDAIFYLQIPPEIAAGRGQYGEERYERLSFQKLVAKQFENLMNDDGRWHVIDAQKGIDEIQRHIQELSLPVIERCHQGAPLLDMR
ncbi:hypothetical protein CBR_g30299 [Chara braunii]|uniref:Thymidylate kinase n=1 Tax=Chara braunii TaxID=69332 RepID=A0A388JX36_CHABU|nr:hypothetical protein CBR_g30299 [Chara braunii]|eukprot:GBG62345.1 hypothetical protein CBR_g30299 [Chara braunii]